MQVTWEGEAAEHFANTVNQSLVGITVEVTSDTGEVFDAVILGEDHRTDWIGTFVVRRVNDNGDPIGKAESVVVEKLLVY